jgi:hypothetical protein
MEKRYRRLENPQQPTGVFHLSEPAKFNYGPPRVGDIVSVSTTGKIYIQILVEILEKDNIKGEIVGIGPVAAPITGTINHDNWELCDTIEIEQSWIDGITYHERK